MTTMSILASLALLLALTGPAAPAPVPATHEEVGRTLEELARELQGWGERWRSHFRPEAPGERPLISLMLHYRAELGLSPAQVEVLERLRRDFQREAIRREADLRVAEMDLAALLAQEPVDLGRVEAKVREIERLRADLRLGRLRVLEEGKAELTTEQRQRLGTLLDDPWPSWPPRPRPGGAPARPPAPGQRL